jgi:hypothetical protein
LEFGLIALFVRRKDDEGAAGQLSSRAFFLLGVLWVLEYQYQSITCNIFEEGGATISIGTVKGDSR